jgi:uncharacterized membrane protein YesL
MWDHFLGVVILNLGFIVLFTIPVLLPQVVVNASVYAALAIQVIGVLLLFIYGGAVAMACRDMANYEKPEFGRFIDYLKETWKSSLVLGLIYVAIVVVLWIGVPVYAGMGSLLGLAALVFLFWALVIWVVSSQFYYPIRAQLDTKISKVIRKSFVIFFDNTFFAIVVAVGSLAVIAVSALTALLIPGVTGLLLWHQVSLKLRLYKYDYLEEHSDANKRQIPWDALLIDDRERVGKRTLRGMIFPWKE